MFRGRRRPSAGTIIGVVALCVALSGVTVAGIPGSDGRIYACYTPDGDLRVIDKEAGASCDASREAALVWNQQGPKGDTGSQGPRGLPGQTGPQGAQGPPGPVSGGFARMVSVKKAKTWYKNKTVTLASLELPAGYYALDAWLNVREKYGDRFGTFKVKCHLDGKTDNHFMTADDAGEGVTSIDVVKRHVPMSLSVLDHLPQGGTVSLKCRTNFDEGSASIQVANVRLRATALSGYTHHVQ